MSNHTDYLRSLANILQMLKDRQSIVETILAPNLLVQPMEYHCYGKLCWQQPHSKLSKGTGAEGHRGTGTAF